MGAEAVRAAPLAGLTLALGALLVALQAVLGSAATERQQRLAVEQLTALAAPVTFDNNPFRDARDLSSPTRPIGVDATLLRAMPLRAGRRQVGLVVDARAPGYLDHVTVRAIFATDGRLLATQVLAQRETAGLGDRLVSRRWLDRFHGQVLVPEEVRLRRDGGQVDQLTGATVTSRAALNALLVAASAALDTGEVSP